MVVVCCFFFLIRFFFLMWTIFFKSLLDLLQCCFCFMFWCFGCEVRGILAPQPGIQPAPPALEGKVVTTGLPGKSLAVVIPVENRQPIYMQSDSWQCLSSLKVWAFGHAFYILVHFNGALHEVMNHGNRSHGWGLSASYILRQC